MPVNTPRPDRRQIGFDDSSSFTQAEVPYVRDVRLAAAFGQVMLAGDVAMDEAAAVRSFSAPQT